MVTALNTIFAKIKKGIQLTPLPSEILKIVETVDSDRWVLDVDRGICCKTYKYTDTVGGFVISSSECRYENDDRYESSVSYLTRKQTRKLFYLIQDKWWDSYHMREKEKLKNCYASN